MSLVGLGRVTQPGSQAAIPPLSDPGPVTARKPTFRRSTKNNSGPRSANPEGPRPVGQNSSVSLTTPPVKSGSTKYSTLPKFGFIVHTDHPGPRRGADRDRHEPRAGQRWTRRRRRERHCRAGLREQSPFRANDTTLTASSHGFGGEHTPPPGSTCEDVRGRRSRVVPTPGVCASSLCGDVAANRCAHQPAAGRRGQ
jgi:hypothetical protein